MSGGHINSDEGTKQIWSGWRTAGFLLGVRMHQRGETGSFLSISSATNETRPETQCGANGILDFEMNMARAEVVVVPQMTDGFAIHEFIPTSVR